MTHSYFPTGQTITDCPHICVAHTTDCPYILPMYSVKETSIFTRRADALLTDADRARLIDMLAFDPEAGDLIQGLGGIRKLRFAPTGRGKSGGFRVIYYAASANLPILALLIYGKGEQTIPTADERRAMLRAVEQLNRPG